MSEPLQIDRRCIVCGQPLHGRQIKFCDYQCEVKHTNESRAQRKANGRPAAGYCLNCKQFTRLRFIERTLCRSCCDRRDNPEVLAELRDRTRQIAIAAERCYNPASWAWETLVHEYGIDPELVEILAPCGRHQTAFTGQSLRETSGHTHADERRNHAGQVRFLASNCRRPRRPGERVSWKLKGL